MDGVQGVAQDGAQDGAQGADEGQGVVLGAVQDGALGAAQDGVQGVVLGAAQEEQDGAQEGQDGAQGVVPGARSTEAGSPQEPVPWNCSQIPERSPTLHRRRVQALQRKTSFSTRKGCFLFRFPRGMSPHPYSFFSPGTISSRSGHCPDHHLRAPALAAIAFRTRSESVVKKVLPHRSRLATRANPHCSAVAPGR